MIENNINSKDAAQTIAEFTAENAELRKKVRELEKTLWKRDHPVLTRALSVSDVLKIKRETYSFEGAWAEAFGEPERNGVWFVWGQSGNGKTSFVLQLCKELCRFGRVAYDSLEEGLSLTMKNAFIKMGMLDVARRLVLLDRENIEQLDARLSKRKSPDIVVIDSFQYTQMSFKEYQAFKERHRNKLLIFISQAEGSKPLGRTAVSVMYDASLKIWVEGYRATSKGRYFGSKGYYTIWDERARLVYGEDG
jgi:hypothetical protein